MRVHRTPHPTFFTTLGNELLRDETISFTALGILVFLLSLPDGARENAETLQARRSEGKVAISRALAQLEERGYYTRTLARDTATNTLRTRLAVHDQPQQAEHRTRAASTPSATKPAATHPASTHPRPAARRFSAASPQASGAGGNPAATTPPTTHPSPDSVEATGPPELLAEGRNREKKPSHPAAAQIATGGATHRQVGRAASAPNDDDHDEPTAAAITLLARIAHAEPRLSLGQSEALHLAPLIIQWRRRGATDPQIQQAVTQGLPATIHSPLRLLHTRLTRKLPPPRPAPRPRHECTQCHDPVPRPGRCRACRDKTRSENRAAGPRPDTGQCDYRQARSSIRHRTHKRP